MGGTRDLQRSPAAGVFCRCREGLQRGADPARVSRADADDQRQPIRDGAEILRREPCARRRVSSDMQSLRVGRAGSLPNQGLALSRMWFGRARVPRPAGNDSAGAVTISGSGRPGWNRTSNPQLRRRKPHDVFCLLLINEALQDRGFSSVRGCPRLLPISLIFCLGSPQFLPQEIEGVAFGQLVVAAFTRSIYAPTPPPGGRYKHPGSGG